MNTHVPSAIAVIDRHRALKRMNECIFSRSEGSAPPALFTGTVVL